MEHQPTNNVTDILDTQPITAMPPPPYSPTEDAAKVANVDKVVTNGLVEAVRLREREATRMDMSVRRSKILSRAGLDDPVFFKMSQLEQLVNSLQSALNDQSMAIHDVHGQLTEINDVLHMMQAKDESTTTSLVSRYYCG
jgi:ABC-type phosphate transport system auxiliary subunit